MEDIVAAKVRDRAGKWYGFMTWGRIVDRIDDSWIVDVIRADAGRCGIGDIAEILVCDSLIEAAACQYFYEGLFHFANCGVPFGPYHETWRLARLDEITQGSPDIYFLGEEREVPS